MRARNLLHKNQLEDFASWLEKRGWIRNDPKGEYEVLRMWHRQHKQPIIVHEKLATNAGGTVQHLTVWGMGLGLSKKFIAERRRERAALRKSGSSSRHEVGEVGESSTS